MFNFTIFRVLCVIAVAFSVFSSVGGPAISGNMAPTAQSTELTILRVEVTPAPDAAAQADAPEALVQDWSLDKLRGLPQQRVRTTTPWTDGAQEFVGVPMLDFLDAHSVTDGDVVLSASNDYSVVASADMLRKTGAVLAYELNGAPMSPRGKGPLWLIWDYDSSSDNRQESIYSLSVWQLDRIHISR